MKIPPVILVKIGEIYFVQDGHHRVSVARAQAQTEIPAIVTIWQVARPLPWAKQAPLDAGSPAKSTRAVQEGHLL